MELPLSRHAAAVSATAIPSPQFFAASPEPIVNWICIAFPSMSGKDNLQLFLSPRLTARSARTVQDEDKLGDLQVSSVFKSSFEIN
jgi:hypothetical protein